MLPIYAILLVLAFILIALVSGNNLSACSGSIISSKIVSRRSGIVITILGYISGLLLEGGNFKGAISYLLPSGSGVVMVAFVTSILIFMYAHFRRVPQSLSLTFATAIIGISVADRLAFNAAYVTAMLAFWVIAPFASVALIIVSMRITRRLINKRDIWSSVGKIKILMIVMSFVTAFTLGANTMGFVVTTLPQDYLSIGVMLAAIILGSAFLSAGELRRVGNEIIAIRYINSINSQFTSAFLVEIATLLGIPLSNTQTFTSSVYGAGLSYKKRLMIKRPAMEIFTAWILMTIVSFLLAYGLTLALNMRLILY